MTKENHSFGPLWLRADRLQNLTGASSLDGLHVFVGSGEEVIRHIFDLICGLTERGCADIGLPASDEAYRHLNYMGRLARSLFVKFPPTIRTFFAVEGRRSGFAGVKEYSSGTIHRRITATQNLTASTPIVNLQKLRKLVPRRDEDHYLRDLATLQWMYDDEFASEEPDCPIVQLGSQRHVEYPTGDVQVHHEKHFCLADDRMDRSKLAKVIVPGSHRFYRDGRVATPTLTVSSIWSKDKVPMLCGTGLELSPNGGKVIRSRLSKMRFESYCLNTIPIATQIELLLQGTTKSL